VIRVALTLALLLGLALAGWLATRSWTHDRGGAAAVAAPPPAARPAPAPAAAAARASERLPPLEELPEPVRRYLEATVYPPTSGLLTPERADLLNPNARHERPRPIPDTLGPDESKLVSSLFTSDRFQYIGEDVAEARLVVQGRDGPIEVNVLRAQAWREGRGGDEGEPEPFVLRRAEDGLRGEIELARFEDHHGPIRLEVEFEYAPDRTHTEELRLFLTPASRIPAVFTGELQDQQQAGGLRVLAGIEVRTPGFYRIDANLFDAAGQPVAFASFKGELSPSDRSVALDFFGKVLRDADAPGPYTLRDLRGYRFLDGSYPDREHIPDAAFRFVTAAHAADATAVETLSGAPRGERARRVRRSQRRGTRRRDRRRRGRSRHYGRDGCLVREGAAGRRACRGRPAGGRYGRRIRKNPIEGWSELCLNTPVLSSSANAGEDSGVEAAHFGERRRGALKRRPAAARRNGTWRSP